MPVAYKSIVFSLYKVRGESMVPTVLPGEVVLLRKRRARSGDLVVVDHARFGVILKRIGPDDQLVGDGPTSTQSGKLGPYEPSRLIGVAVLAFTPRGMRRLSERRSGNRA